VIQRIPLLWLAVIAAWLAIAPITPEPHLIEKTRMLVAGTLSRPIDIFDLALHSVPLMLFVWKLIDIWLKAKYSNRNKL
jgi:hypothetical protein